MENQDLGQLFNLDDLKKFRQNMHKYPEIGFQEVETQKNIIQFLKNLSISEKDIIICGKTGLYVDIYGKAQKDGEENRLIALRADIDALPMTEENPELEYRSQTKADHACGHDGHTATLLGFVQVYLSKIDKIPSNKGVRVFFQPSEEGPISGAKAMMEEGIMKGVSEVYGYHNWPMHTVGHLLVKPGPMMASQTVIRIQLIGKGGHGADPRCLNPIQMGIRFYDKFEEVIKPKFEGRKYVCTFPVFNSGERFNVVADIAKIEGTLRSLEKGLPEEFKQEIIQALEEIKVEFKGDYKLDYFLTYDQVNNHEKETEHVVRLAKQYFKPEQVGDFGIIPVMASEDFSFYLDEIPGCFFFLGSGRKMNDMMLHNSHYNFNDDLLTPGAEFFWKIVEDRLFLKS